MEIFLILILILITLIIVLGTIYALWIGFEQWQYMHDPHKMLFLSSTNTEIDEKLEQIIAKYLPETQEYNLVELGCGKAIVLKSLAQKYKWKSIIGVEGQKSVWLQAWINCNLIPRINREGKSKKLLSKGVKVKNFGEFTKTNSKIDEKDWPLAKKGTTRFPYDILSEGSKKYTKELDTSKENSVLNQKITLLNQDIFDYQSPKPTFHYCYLGVKLMNELHEKGLFVDSILVTLDYGIEGLEPIEIIELNSKNKIQNKLLIYKF